MTSGTTSADGDRSRRRCAGCSAPLAVDNTGRMCGKCHREQRDQLRTPPVQLRDEFWTTDDFRAAFESQHIGKVLRVYRNHPRHLELFGRALNQDLVGRWLGLTQAQVSKLENGPPEQNLKTLQNYAQTLHMPQRMLWFDLPGQTRLVLPGGDAPGQTRSGILVASTGMDTLELLKRVRNSDVNPSTIDALSITVEQLCCDYNNADADELIVAGREWLSKMTDLLGSHLTLTQHRDVLHNAGMLALLVGCLENDLGDSRSAEGTRRMAMELGQESGSADVVGWAHEMLSWFHLTAGNYRGVIAAAEAGIQAAPEHSVAVQLYGQQAKAYARMGRPEEVRRAMDQGSRVLDRLPYPDRPDNHFVVDPDKWDFYAMDTYRIVGDDDLARRNAEEVVRRSRDTNGTLVAPMRNAEAQLTLAVLAARAGDADRAAELGVQALQADRQSLPSLRMVAGELGRELDATGTEAGAEFREFLRDIGRDA